MSNETSARIEGESGMERECVFCGWKWVPNKQDEPCPHNDIHLQPEPKVGESGLSDEEAVKQVYPATKPEGATTPSHQHQWSEDGSCVCGVNEDDTCAHCETVIDANGGCSKCDSTNDEHEVDEKALLPCPFCGGIPRLGESEDGGHFIECSKCGGSTNLTYFLMDDASRDVRERWNKRAK